MVTSALPAQTPAPAPAYEALNAVLWVQTAAEYKAVSLQTFRSAALQLELALKQPSWTAALEQEGRYGDLPPAVILDLDETVLDNSAFRVRLMRERRTYSEAEWEKWVRDRRATAVPGAVEFLTGLQAHGVAAFYLSNRICNPTDASDATAGLVKSLQFPFRPERLLCRGSASDSGDKSARRAKVAATHRVLLVLGDDLNDFISVAKTAGGAKALALRDRIVEAHQAFWGTRWFMLPNPVYGSWERAIGEDLKAKIEALHP